MDNKEDIFLSNSEKKYLKALLGFIQQGQYVFIVSPNGMSRRTIINESIEELTNKDYSCHYFDIQTMSYLGVYSLYEEVLQKISGKRIKIKRQKNHLEEFIRRLEQHINKPTVLYFNNIRSIDKEFYDNFSKVCVKIYNRPKSILTTSVRIANLVMVFGGFLSEEQLNLSPLNDITEKIKIYPIPDTESQDVIKNHLGCENVKRPSPELVQWIDKQTSGFHYTITLICRYVAKTYPDPDRINYDTLLDDIVDDIMKTIYQDQPVYDNEDVNDKKKDQKAKKHDHVLRRYFLHIIEYLQKSDSFFDVILDLMEKEQIVGTKTLPAIDHVTIAGVISKLDNNEYTFSNDIYKRFIVNLLEDHSRADYCMFHALNDRLWEKGLSIYQSLESRRRQRSILIDNNSFLYLKSVLINRLRRCQTIESLLDTFSTILIYIFDASKFGLFLPKMTQNNEMSLAFDRTFYKTCKHSKLISEEDVKFLSTYISRVWETQTPLMDWTGEWLAIPVSLDDQFKRIFLIEISDELKKFQEKFSDFIFTAITIYRYMRQEKRNKQEESELSSAIYDNIQKQKYYFEYDRGVMDELWSQAKILFMQLKMRKYYYNEILPTMSIIQTAYNDGRLQNTPSQPENKKILTRLSRQMDKETKRIVKTKINEVYYLCGILDNDVVMILEWRDYNEQKLELLFTCFELFHYTINLAVSEMQLRLLNNTLVNTDDCIYIINNRKRMIFSNHRLNQLLHVTENQLIGRQCHEALYSDSFDCKNCPVEDMFQQTDKTSVHITRKINIGSNHKIMDCNYMPILDKDGRRVAAIAVYMHDLTERQSILWNALENIQRCETEDDIGKEILNTLKQLGFSRVFQWRPDDKNKKLYKSEDFKGLIRNIEKGNQFRNGSNQYTLTQTNTLQGKISIRYRLQTQKRDMLQLIRDRFSSTRFEIRCDRSQPAHDPERIRPDFWVVVPIYADSGIVKVYILDNDIDKDNQKNINMLTLDKMQLLETFSTTAGLIWEKTRKRHDYIDKLQAMLTHSSLEPLQLMRMFIYEMAEETDPTERQHLAEITDGALEMVQSTLSSLNELERNRSGRTRIAIESINVSDLMKAQVNIFKEYALYSDILFDLKISDSSIVFSSDRKIISLVLNNLIGNAIRYLQKNEDIVDKKICFELDSQKDGILIRISDNGPGFPNSVAYYLKAPFDKETPYPGGGLGIGFSRECASLVKGDIRLSKTNFLGHGASMELFFYDYNEKG
ncbi:protein containing PAS fold-4 [Candidatus Magnetomorum sp. HK-1]|nr:protein containing PAS fold-4 [Candidatus Magnetomorum sp. HK-1]